MEKYKEEILNKVKEIEEIEKNNNIKNININDIKYLGMKEISQKTDEEIINHEVDIYVVIEDNTKKYYFNKECVAIETNDVGIVFKDEYKKYKEDDPILDIIELLKNEELNVENKKESKENLKEKIYSLNDLTNEKIQENSELLKNKGAIKEVIDISLEQKIEQKETEEAEKKYGEENVLNKEETKSLNIMEETSTNQILNGSPLWKVLGIDPEYTKLSIVCSEDVNNKDGTEYTFVAKKENGESLILNNDFISLDKAIGTSKSEKDLTIDVNENVNEETSFCSFKINAKEGAKKGDFYLKIGWDENSGREIKIEDRGPGMGNEGVVYELETNITRPRDNDSKKMQAETGTHKANEVNKKYNEYNDIKNKDNDINVSDIDNNPNNDQHEHIDANELIPNTSITWKEFAGMIGERGDGSIEKSYKKFFEEKNKNPDINNNELIEKMEEEANKEIHGPGKNR